MPRLPHIKSPILRRVVEAQRYSPKAALLRIIHEVELFSDDIDPEAVYPHTELVRRLTGFTSSSGSGEVMTGAEILADLSSMSEHLCVLADHSAADPDAEMLLSRDDVLRRWTISVKTLARWRGRGLVARRVRHDPGRWVLAFHPGVVERFEARHIEMLSRAGSFARLDEGRVLAEARALLEREEVSMHAAANIISQSIGGTPEGVRQVLLRHEARTPLFDRRSPMSSRERAVAWRAWLRGIEPSDIAHHVRRPSTNVQRGIRVHRAAILKQIPQGDHQPAELRDEGTPTSIAADPLVVLDVPDLRAWADEQPRPDAGVEAHLASRHQTLRWIAGQITAELHVSSPVAGRLDDAETALRNASRAKLGLAVLQLPIALRGIEQRLGLGIDRLRPATRAELLDQTLRTIGDSIERFDVRRGGRLASPVGIAANRIGARFAERLGESAPDTARQVVPGRVIRRHLLALDAWMPRLGPGQALRDVLGVLREDDARLLSRRFGAGTSEAHTLRDIADELQTTPTHAARAIRRAVRAARSAARTLSL
jgi:uncharacterized protein YeaO (DUF488 family)